MAAPVENQTGTNRQPRSGSLIDNEVNRYCFTEWMNLQELDLAELVQAQTLSDHVESTENLYARLTRKSVDQFENHVRERSHLARSDPLPFFAPAWCSSLENSLLWIGGCRPSMFLRLIYTLCGSDINLTLNRSLHGTSESGPSTSQNCLKELSGQQLYAINSLQLWTVKEEDRVTGRLVSLQEEIADRPIALVAQRDGPIGEATDREVERGLNEHERTMTEVLEAADQLRLRTLKEVVGILTAGQAVEFLAAGKKLHLCVHELGKKRDHLHGRNN